MVDTTEEAVRGLVLRLCGSFQLRRLLVSSIELGQTSSRRRQDSAEGQLWGNPVYNWDALRATGYRWCVERIRALLAHVDMIRLDHFRGFAAGWHVPAKAPTARSGQWVPGPGAALFLAVEKELGRLPLIAEDLGIITDE
jgi:4-alpha-glucanotransferase